MIDSPLPEDLRSFERDESALVVRHDSGRVVRSRACGGQLCSVHVPVCTHQLLAARHFPAYRLAPVFPLGVKLHLYAIWVKIAEVDLHLEFVPPLVAHHLQLAETQFSPMAL